MFAVILLVFLLGIALGGAWTLAHHDHELPSDHVYPDLAALQSASRLLEASAQARQLMLDQNHRHRPHGSFGDKAS
jgi:hypothetical protein